MFPAQLLFEIDNMCSVSSFINHIIVLPSYKHVYLGNKKSMLSPLWSIKRCSAAGPFNATYRDANDIDEERFGGGGITFGGGSGK